jgi:hypothetical protein
MRPSLGPHDVIRYSDDTIAGFRMNEARVFRDDPKERMRSDATKQREKLEKGSLKPSTSSVSRTSACG